jgi:hypothetical protein
MGKVIKRMACRYRDAQYLCLEIRMRFPAMRD